MEIRVHVDSSRLEDYPEWWNGYPQKNVRTIIKRPYVATISKYIDINLLI